MPEKHFEDAVTIVKEFFEGKNSFLLRKPLFCSLVDHNNK